ncbi:hypothetical protein K8R20_01380 [bacterium]|nr:hypothetical protein [bacterium]
MSEMNNPIETGFTPKARDSHDIKTLPGGVKNALLVATLVGASGIGACTPGESSAAPVEPTPMEQYDPTLVMENLPDPTDVAATFTPVPSPTLTQEPTPTATEVVVDLSGLEVFANDPEQKGQVLEFVKFRDALNGCNGSVESLRTVDTGNEEMNSAMRLLADHVEQGGKWNSIALAFALKEAFPDLGVPKIGDEIRETVIEVFRDNSDPRLNPDVPFMIAVMNKGYDFPQLAIIPTLNGGSILLGPPEDLYPKLDGGSIIFRKNIEIKENREMGDLQIVLAKSVGVEGEIFLLVVEFDEEGKMTVYTSQENEDELITNKQFVIKDGYSGPNIFPSSPPGG